MYSNEAIEACALEIAEKFDPLQVILFGSHANGSAHFDSDVDLLVIMPLKEKSSKTALKIRRSIDKTFPLDLLVKDPVDTENRLSQGDPFLTKAFQEGKVLYERS